MDTKIFKGRDGWRAETRIDLGMVNKKGAKLELEIDTRKGSRGLQTYATVYAIDGYFRSHTFDMGSGRGDFSKRLEDLPGARCTEKSIRTLHESVIGRASAITELAKAHYATKAEPTGIIAT